MSPGLTMERVYDAIRHRIIHAELAPGTRLDPARLADDLNASATPVRDALHRLLGERLVDARPQEGFHVPVHSEATLRDLHAWSLDLLLAAMRPAIASLHPVAQSTEPPSSDTSTAARTAALFDAITAGSGNYEHRIAMANLNARLRPFRTIENRAISDGDAEIQALEKSWSAEDMTSLKRQLVAYHRRRMKLVPQISGLMRAPI